MAGVRLHGIAKSFGAVQTLQGIDLAVPDGSFTVIVGPSGCGKSTLLRIVAGLEEATAGTVEIGGRDVTHVDAADRGVAMVFQNYALYPHMNVAENMGFSLRVARAPRAEIERKVARAAAILRIEPLLGRRPRQLSGGQRQRVAIGRAIVRDPAVFLFDEPLSNLDAELRVRMRAEIATLRETLGSTMVYVTHDQVEAMTLATQIVVLRAGAVEQAGTPAELYDDPANAFVAQFIGTPRMNLLRGRVVGGRAVLAAGPALPLRGAQGLVAEGDEVAVGLRPGLLDRPDLGAADTSIEGRVELIENLGGAWHVHARLAGGEALVAERRSPPPFGIGDRAAFAVRSGDALLFREDGTRLRPARAGAS